MEDKSYFLGVKFAGTSKSYYFSTETDDWNIGDLVVVETISGLEMGTVSTRPMDQELYKSNLALKPVLRRPNQGDMDDYNFNLEQAKRAIRIAQKQIEGYGLPMNLLEANYTLDGTKVTITYTADQRVDFRELLKTLAPQLHCRIELRQIAPRDEAKLIGGLGTCGLPLCCSTFLDQFDGISISRAKNQMLTLNIPKLSGACGKLICCLLFEDDMYTEAKKAFPRLGTPVKLDDGDYTIVGMNILSKEIKLSGNSQIRFMSLEDVEDALKGIKRKPKADLEMAKPTFKSDLVAEEVSHAQPEQRENRNDRDNRNNGGNRNNNNRNFNRHNHNNLNNNNQQQNAQNQQNGQNRRPGNGNNNHRHHHHHNNQRPNNNNKKPNGGN